MLAINTGRRPKRSARSPTKKAPTGRVARVAGVVNAIAGIDLPNSLATAGRTNTSTKKSNASKVQPRNPAATAFRAFAREIAGVGVILVDISLHQAVAVSVTKVS